MYNYILKPYIGLCPFVMDIKVNVMIYTYLHQDPVFVCKHMMFLCIHCLNT